MSEVGCDATTLMSRVRIDDVNDFVPDDHLDASFLDDTRDTKTASAAREDEEEEEEDRSEVITCRGHTALIWITV